MVVIGVIAILVAMLLPVVQKARRAAEALQCSSNMSQIGRAFYAFAAMHDGRSPASVGYYNASSPTNKYPGVTWNEMLGVEVFSDSKYIPRIVNPGITRTGKLYCPTGAMEAIPTGSPYTTRAYGVNYDLITDTLLSLSDFKKMGSQYDSVLPGVIITYTLGPKLTLFRNASTKIMVAEQNESNDTINYSKPNNSLMVLYPSNTGSTTLIAADPLDYPAGNACWVFRHNRKMNILFIDGHVEAVPFDPDMGNQRYLYPNP